MEKGRAGDYGNISELVDSNKVHCKQKIKMRHTIKDHLKGLRIFEVALQDSCKCCDLCWKGIEWSKWTNESMKEFEEWENPSEISLPYIGENYTEARVLILGLNLNRYGGEDALKNLVQWSKDELSKGRRKVKFEKQEYNGTIYWHRLASYATLFMEDTGRIEKKRWNNFPANEDIIKALDFIAITNAVKCSPNRYRSVPTEAMKINCTDYILKQEIEILNPKKILILGIDTLKVFKRNVIDEVLEEEEENKVTKGVGIIGDNKVEFYAVFHPAYPRGGSKVENFKTLEKLIKKN